MLLNRERSWRGSRERRKRKGPTTNRLLRILNLLASRVP
jgi:hypothetical protein